MIARTGRRFPNSSTVINEEVSMESRKMSEISMKRKSAVSLAAALAVFAWSSITERRNITAAAPNESPAGKQIALYQSEAPTDNKARDVSQDADQTKPLFQVIIKPASANPITSVYPQPGRVTADGAALIV